MILLKGSLIIAQHDSFIENSEEQEEGLKVENVDDKTNNYSMAGFDRDDNA